MIKPKQPLTLVLFPNYFGIAYLVCEGPKNILDYGSKSIKPFGKAKYIQAIQNLFDYAKPNIIILRAEENGRYALSSKRLGIITEIKKRAKTDGLKVFEYSRHQIREVFSHFDAITKYEITKLLVEWFPQLKGREPQKRLTQDSENYQMQIFDCFALMLTKYYLE